MGLKTVGVGCFFVGVVTGVAGTYLYLQKWVNDKIHEEIQVYREKYSEERKAAEKESRGRKVVEDDDDDADDYKREDRIKNDADELVSMYSNKSREKGGYGGFIQVVPPLEFERFEEDPKYESYDRVYLTYYHDGVLVESESKDLVLDLRSTVGIHFKDHFEDYEDDNNDIRGTACYIRNDKLKIFYEITKDFRTYKEALGKDVEK